MKEYRVVKKLKGIVYFFIFVLMGFSILLDVGDGRLSSVAVYIGDVYPILTFSAIFMLSGLLNLYIGWRNIDWQIWGFFVLYVYSIAVMLAYFNEQIPFIAIPVYIGLSLSTAFDVAMDVFIVPKYKETSEKWWKVMQN